MNCDYNISSNTYFNNVKFCYTFRLFLSFHCYKYRRLTLAGVAQWAECSAADCRVVSSLPSQAQARAPSQSLVGGVQGATN